MRGAPTTVGAPPRSRTAGRPQVAATLLVGLATGALCACNLTTFAPGTSPTLSLACAFLNTILGFTPKQQVKLCGTSLRLQPTYALGSLKRPSGVTNVASLTMSGVAPKGKIAGGKLPDWEADLYPDLAARAIRRVAANLDVTVTALALDNNGNPAQQSFQTAKATIWAVDRKGKRRKLATNSGRYDADQGGVSIEFTGLKPPQSHYAVLLETDTGNVNGGRVAYIAAITQPGGAFGRRARSALPKGLRAAAEASPG